MDNGSSSSSNKGGQHQMGHRDGTCSRRIKQGTRQNVKPASASQSAKQSHVAHACAQCCHHETMAHKTMTICRAAIHRQLLAAAPSPCLQLSCLWPVRVHQYRAAADAAQIFPIVHHHTPITPPPHTHTKTHHTRSPCLGLSCLWPVRVHQYRCCCQYCSDSHHQTPPHDNDTPPHTHTHQNTPHSLTMP
jgi:hypothetical protein